MLAKRPKAVESREGQRQPLELVVPTGTFFFSNTHIKKDDGSVIFFYQIEILKETQSFYECLYKKRKNINKGSFHENLEKK